ncbi:hypothetical protein BU14_1673s0001 [Porphyra umbilicalis]|uniref:glutamine--tRNA ligase n=1 Tax=Porphyra umbilicalis TaxID=2786 RepID=A0A1X6NLD1_PORUM|nr:hypothetical protein BU14_1673s0001 [Porphyra umbilicalis]|eukprot:OSX69276.1 hypothetical protein BU14_1673s0001 [Porphyra umbilicalis]
MNARAIKDAENSPELLAAAAAATGGGVVTRFPPEPNGHLHVGHAKAMFLDFGVARKSGGTCILRFDDTNPTAEKVEYMASIQEMVGWLGHEPTRVTYSSDYFGRLYELAEELIDRGKAYVCHQTSAEMKAGREAKAPSPWRDRSVADNRRLFAAMRAGKYGEGSAVLRMKIDMQSLNPCMQDPIAYRIKYAPHPHVGDAWCVYPSYDYTHCIVDSLEWVTHSMCTLEFEIRRDSYYWLLAALDLYRPFVWEFSRLTLAHTVVSKRRLARLVSSGSVRGWDDPRMSTLAGLRRRGFPADAINRFCAAIGVSRGENLIPLHVLEHWVRLHTPLFRSADASKLGSDEWLADVDPASEEVITGAVVERGLADAAAAGDRFQFERVGYFCVDPDSRPDLLVFNRIVSLRESAARAGMAG